MSGPPLGHCLYDVHNAAGEPEDQRTGKPLVYRAADDRGCLLLEAPGPRLAPNQPVARSLGVFIGSLPAHVTDALNAVLPEGVHLVLAGGGVLRHLVTPAGQGFDGADHDFFVIMPHGLDAATKTAKLIGTIRAMAKAIGANSFWSSPNCFGLKELGANWRCQVARYVFADIAGILHGFDVDSCAFATDRRKRVYGTGRALDALKTRVNVVCGSRRSC